MVSQKINDFLMGLSAEDITDLAGYLNNAMGLAAHSVINTLELIITEDCPFRCDYCFVEGKNSSRKMSEETARTAIDFVIKHSGDSETITIILFGGEPLMEFPLIRTIISYAEERVKSVGKNLSWALTTNGLLVDAEKMEFLRSYGINVLLSLDGSQSTHDAHRRLADGGPTFDLVYPKISLIKQYQAWLGTRMTVNPDTAPNLLEDVRFLDKSGINQFIIGPNVDARWSQWDLSVYTLQKRAVAEYYIQEKEAGSFMRMREFEETPDEIVEKRGGMWGCDAGRQKIAVNTEGFIFGCSKFAAANGGKGRCAFGHVEQGITDPKMRAALADNRVMIRGKCFHCENSVYCTGGCPAENINLTGSIFIPDSVTCYFAKHHTNLLRSMPRLTLVHRDHGNGRKADHDSCSCEDAPLPPEP